MFSEADMERYSRAPAVFDKIPPQITAPPAQSTDARIRISASPFRPVRRMRWLVDENLGPRLVRPLKANGDHFTIVKKWNAGASDESLFQHALETDMAIVSSDQGFANYERHRLADCAGALVIPNGSAVHGKQLIALALTHFVRNFEPLMASRPGIVAHYESSGQYTVYEAAPDLPQGRKSIAYGRYTHG